MLAQAPMFNMIFALLVTLALILAGAWLLRLVNPQTLQSMNNKRLRKLESLPLSNQHTLHLVSIDEQEHIVLTAPNSTDFIPLAKKKGKS